MISDDLRDRIEEGRAGRNQGFSTGSKHLDNTINGVQRRTFYLIGGETSTGKSAFVDHCFVLHPYYQMISDPDRKKTLRVFYKSFEIEKVEKAAKWVAHLLFMKYGIITHISEILTVNNNRMTADVYTKVIESLDFIDKMSEFVHIQDVTTNPTGIYMDTSKYMKENGKIVEEIKVVRGQDIKFHKYIPNDLNEVVLVITDHIGSKWPIQN